MFYNKLDLFKNQYTNYVHNFERKIYVQYILEEHCPQFVINDI